MKLPTRRHGVLAASLVLAAALAACSQQELYSQLSERQANEMVALLRNAGIPADKQALDNNLYAVSAPQDQFAPAIELLRANGYPRDGFDDLGKVFKKEGFVSSPLEEHARLQHALSQEIANTISSIDGVVVARVHVSVPEKDPLSDKLMPASASVFIKHRAGVDLSGQVGHIKALVVNAIQGLPYDSVTVALFPSEPWPAQAPAPRLATLGGLEATLRWVAAAGAVALAAGGGLLWWQRRRSAAATSESAQVLQWANGGRDA